MPLSQARHVTHDSTVQTDVDNLVHWTEANYMQLNPSKCIVLLICFMRNPPPPPVVTVKSTTLEVVEFAKILGVIFQANLKWDIHVNMMVSKGSRRLYLLRVLKRHGLDSSDLTLVFCGFIRPILEYACPVWHPGITSAQSRAIENVQKRACRMILGSTYVSYDMALDQLSLPSLCNRRHELCTKFGTSLLSSSSFSKWLPPNRVSLHGRNLRSKHQITQFHCRTARYRKTTLPYLVDLLNSS